MNKFFSSILFIPMSIFVLGQVGVNNPKPKATFHISPISTDSKTPEGLILPSLTLEQLISKDDIYGAEQESTIIYVSDLSGILSAKTRNISSVGYYYFDGTEWKPILSTSIAKGSWNKIGTDTLSIDNNDDIYTRGKIVIGGNKIDTVYADQQASLTVIGGDVSIDKLTLGQGSGTKNNNIVLGFKNLISNENGTNNIAFGADVLQKNTMGHHNIGIGAKTLTNNTTGNLNFAFGANSLANNVTGNFNFAIGYQALENSIGADYNMALGNFTLSNNETGTYNVGIGSSSLSSNKTGTYNVSIGYASQMLNENGNRNISLGSSSLLLNNSDDNIAIGHQALQSNSTGSNNIALGNFAFAGATNTGSRNIAIGNNSLILNESGEDNVAIGFNSLYNSTEGNNNVVIGSKSNIGDGNNSTISNGVAIGATSSVTGNYGIAIGNTAKAKAENSIAIGAGVTNTIANSVMLGNNNITKILSNATGITSLSDQKVQKDIQENVPGITFISKLKPITYRLETSSETEKVQSGFIAQEVEQAAQEEGYDFSGIYSPKNDGDPYGITYATFVVPLVKAVQEQQEELLKQQEKIEKLELLIKELQEKQE